MLLSLTLAALLRTVAPPAVAAAPAPVRAAPDDPEVCRTITDVGHHVGHRECMKRSEWKQLEEGAHERYMRSGGLGLHGGSPCPPGTPC